jgi:hypothetical protein
LTSAPTEHAGERDEEAPPRRRGRVELPVGVVLGGAEWQPTLPLLFLGSLLSNEVRFRFTAAPDSAWLVDDVYIDPYGKG